MSGRTPFRELAAQVTSTPEGRQRVDDYRHLMDAVVTLYRLREERGLTQVEVADVLDVTQGNVSRLEHASDLYLSSLSRYVEALGGRLELTAVFPDQVVSLEVANGGGSQRTRGD
jgi:predicted XRE-type DNA-binding protein